MQPSMFNLQVALPETNEVFLMNTFSDAQLLVTPDVTRLLERLGHGEDTFNDEERSTIDTLVENGFVVASREQEQAELRDYFIAGREDTEQLRVTVLTTLQCNFACDYCMQGDHGDHNLFAHKMSLETAARVGDWDHVVKLEGACALLIAQLKRNAAERPLGSDEAQLKSRIMQRILVNDAEIRQLAEPWLEDLDHILAGRPKTVH